MITKYIDMSLMGTSGSGTTGDPYSFLAFKAYAENVANWTDDHTFKFRNRGYIHNSCELFNLTESTGANNYAVILESDTAEPAVLKTVLSQGSFSAMGLIEIADASSVTVNNLIFEYTDAGSDTDPFCFIGVYSNGEIPGVPLIVKNCWFYANITASAPNADHSFLSSFGNITSVGNSFKYSGVATSSSVDCICSFVALDTNAVSMLISSNYFDGNVKDCVIVNSDSLGNDFITGNIRNNYVYNNSDLLNIVNVINGTQSGLISSGNVDNSGNTSQFPLYTDSYDGTHSVLTPQEGSALIDAGYAESGWETDLFGQTRDASPDVGAAEYQGSGPVTCWNYTARYKGSNRLFKMNGGGKYPSELRVPGNVDISTGRMIDEGQLIDPNQFKIIQ